MRIARTLVMAMVVAIGLWLVVPGPAAAQSLTTFATEASYTAALPTAGVTTTVEGFASVTSNRPVSTTTPDQWNGFTLLAQGTSNFGSSSYCVSLRSCMSWTASPPTQPGVYAAVADPSLGNGRLIFTPAARAFGFGLEYWDWNDGGQRSQIVVTLSNGAVFNVTGPTTTTGDPGGFIGFRIDQTSVNAGITISSVAWVALSGNSEIIGLRNVRVSTINPLVVTNTNNSGTGSLRNAVQFANTQGTASTISFAIAGAGPHTITLASALPDLTANGMMIDGTSQSGTQCRDLWAGSGHDLRVNVRGAGFNGFRLGGTNQTIRGLSLTGFDNAVFTLAGSSNATIQCNYLGLLANGTSSANSRGVLVRGASARIGGLDAGQGNVISANSIVGVVTEQGSTDTAIRGNFIGTDPTGMTARANGTGINNFNGTVTWRDITRNLISGNNGNAGIMLETDDRISPSDGQIRIQSNIIGFNRTLSAVLRNTGEGILFDANSITGVLIGGTASTEGNTITGDDDGIELRSVGSITIRGNTIAAANARGLHLNNVTTVAVGGTGSGQGNSIGGNGTDGIHATNASSGLTILGNLIQPLTITGSTMANGGHGISLNGTTNVAIGDGTAAGRNVIGGNRRRAISAAGTNASTTINGNYIGTDATGNTAVANGQSEGTTTRDAISFDQGGTFTNLAIINNVIGGHEAAHIELFTSTGTGITIQGNSIGVGANGTSRIVSGSGQQLIRIGGGGVFSNLMIGGTGADQGNIIAFGDQSGVLLDTTGSNIQVIGNTIRDNAGNGIMLLGSTRAAIVGNRIFANGLLGIDLGSNGVSPNDAGDGDTGANEGLNFPQAIAANVQSANQLRYSFTLDVPAAANGYRIDFFASTAADPSGFGEGERYLGHVDIAHAGGAQTYNGTLTTLEPVSIGNIITATASRRTAGGDWDITSEFSAAATATGTARLDVVTTSAPFVSNPANPLATPANDLTLSTTVTNAGTGSTDADSIFLAITINGATTFLNAPTPAFGGVVRFQSSSGSLTFTPATDLRFSNATTRPTALAQCTYTPVAGYDPQVRHVCLNPKGTLPSGASGQFIVEMRVQVN